MLMRAYAIAASAALVAGCAADPRQIEASYVPEMAYQGATCEDIQRELPIIERQLAILSDAQSDRRAADAAMLILIGISPSLFNSPAARESEIARLKGANLTLRNKAAVLECPVPPLPPELAPRPAPQQRAAPDAAV